MSNRVIIADIKSNSKDGHSEGHYFSVAQNYYDLLSDDYDVQIAGGPVYRTKFNDVFELPYNSDANDSKLKAKIHSVLNGIFLFRKAKDCTIILQCNAVSTIIGLLAFIKPKNKIYLIQYDRMISESLIRRLLFNKAKKMIHGVICPGSEIGESLGLPYCVIPDYIYTGKNIEGNSENIYDFGIYGILSSDKGVLEAAEFFAKTPYKLKIAGKIAGNSEDAEMAKNLLNLVKQAPNVDLTIGYLTDEEYNNYIATTKYMVLNYSGVYMLRSSGVILDALFAGKPVLAKRRKYVEFVNEYGLGYLYDDIKDLDLQKVMDAEEYESLRQNIREYLNQQKKNCSVLKRFIGE